MADGPEDKTIYSGKEVDAIYIGDRAAPNLEAVSNAATAKAEGNLTIEEQIMVGELLFAGTCFTCHQGNVERLAGVFPPLAKSSFLTDHPERLSEFILHGLQGSVTVNGQDYHSVMPPMSQLIDDKVASISTYVLNSWGNPGGAVSKEEAAEMRATTSGGDTQWH